MRTDDCDVLLTPVTLDAAPAHSDFSALDNRTQTTRQDFCTQPANLAGLPAATVPVTLARETGLPISLQVVGQFGGEQAVLELAKWIENRVDFPMLYLL